MPIETMPVRDLWQTLNPTYYTDKTQRIGCAAIGTIGLAFAIGILAQNRTSPLNSVLQFHGPICMICAAISPDLVIRANNTHYIVKINQKIHRIVLNLLLVHSAVTLLKTACLSNPASKSESIFLFFQDPSDLLIAIFSIATLATAMFFFKWNSVNARTLEIQMRKENNPTFYLDLREVTITAPSAI